MAGAGQKKREASAPLHIVLDDEDAHRPSVCYVASRSGDASWSPVAGRSRGISGRRCERAVRNPLGHRPKTGRTLRTRASIAEAHARDRAGPTLALTVN